MVDDFELRFFYFAWYSQRPWQQRLESFIRCWMCDFLLQVRELILQGVCAGLLPSIGIHGLADHEVVLCEFAPMKDYGRGLAVHWNERQMRRRDVEESVIHEIAKIFEKTFTSRSK